LSLAGQPAQEIVLRTPGFAALWDFVRRGPDGRFAAHTPKGERHDLTLDAVNYVRDYWSEGRAATYADFPVIDEGPFGKAVVFRDEPDKTFRPVLLVPRARLHDSRIDAKGPGRSVSMVIWVKRETGAHALGGIWHEGTDMGGTTRVEAGRRQYAIFAGLAANPGASAAHVSENGARSFGDKYARNLSVTPEVIRTGEWVAVGMVFDNRRNRVTSYIDGKATDYWIENPQKHPFFQWPARAWGKEFRPPEGKPRKREKSGDGEILTYEYTKVRVTREGGEEKRELVALRANPFWFPHDLYTPPGAGEGGPFTIGRVIHTSRSVGFTGAIGGVAVFDRVLNDRQMRRLAAIGRAASK
jgi:hypothetical protein